MEFFWVISVFFLGVPHTVRLTSVGNLLPGYQEFQIAPNKTIVGQAEKK
jgi:hypothetical protein